jgi:hypothetical protein
MACRKERIDLFGKIDYGGEFDFRAFGFVCLAFGLLNLGI